MNRIYKVAPKRIAPYFSCPKSGMDIPLKQQSVSTWNSFSNFTKIILNTTMSVVQIFNDNIASCIMKEVVKKITDRSTIEVKTKGRSKKRWRVEVINVL
jgi:hypothetical protein